jgi:hypothetical protein
MVVSYGQYLVATKCLIYLPTYIVTTYTLYILTYDTNLLTWGISKAVQVGSSRVDLQDRLPRQQGLVTELCCGSSTSES